MRRFLATVFTVLSAFCIMIAATLCEDAVTDITKGVGTATHRAQENARKKAEGMRAE